MKNILFLLKGFPRISETFVAQEIQLLEELGHEIHIYAMLDPNEKVKQPILKKINAQVNYLPSFSKYSPTYWNSMLFCLKTHPIRFTSSLISSTMDTLKKRPNKPWKRFIQACWLTKQIKINHSNFKHLHCHFAHEPAELGFRVHQILKIDFSISAHAKDIYTFPTQQLEKRVQSSKFISTCTIANYQYLKNKLSSCSNKVKCNYHGIDLEAFKPAINKPINTKPLILSVARLVQKKGYEDILKSLSIIKNKNINFEYHILGEGILRNELEKLCSELNLCDQVFFHGRVTQDEVKFYIHKSDIFVSGSKILMNGDRDGIPNTIAESMAMGLPVVATKQAGIQELIEHNYSGYLCEPGSPESLASGISKLLQNPTLSSQFAKNGRSKVEKVFDNKKWIVKCSQLFEKEGLGDDRG